VRAWVAETWREPRLVQLFALAMALMVLGMVIAVEAWRFVSPPDRASALTSVRLAQARDFALGSVTGYWITSDGGVRQSLDSSGYL
jgi:hypothetical protein